MYLTALLQLQTNFVLRWLTLAAISIGLERTWRPGPRQKMRWIRLWPVREGPHELKSKLIGIGDHVSHLFCSPDCPLMCTLFVFRFFLIYLRDPAARHATCMKYHRRALPLRIFYDNTVLVIFLREFQTRHSGIMTIAVGICIFAKIYLETAI